MLEHCVDTFSVDIVKIGCDCILNCTLESRSIQATNTLCWAGQAHSQNYIYNDTHAYVSIKTRKKNMLDKFVRRLNLNIHRLYPVL